MIVFILTIALLLQSSEPRHVIPMERIASMKFDHHMISSGDNYPAIHMDRDSLDMLLVALRYGHREESIRGHLNWTAQEYDARIRVLLDNGYLLKSGERYVPTISILTIAEAESLRAKSVAVAGEIADSIIAIIPRVRELYGRTSTSAVHHYDDMAFFLLSDVLLDNWQINRVESEFLRRPRTSRHGKNYFYQIAEKDTNTSVEAFGVYGNQYRCGDSVCVVLYGNNRNSERRDFSELAALPSPSFHSEDLALLDTMASAFEPALLSILEASRETFRREFDQSPFTEGMTFEEYFIWWYHLIYTDATDMLAGRGYLTLPESGVFYYKFNK